MARMRGPGDAMGAVAGVVLAAGASTRMGRNKLLLELDGASLLRRAVTRALDAGLDPVVVVLGHEAEQARPELRDLPVRVAQTSESPGGLAASLRAGLNALPGDTPAAVVLLADMPLVTSEMLRSLAHSYGADPVPIVASDYEGVTAPPVLYDRALFPELAALNGESAGREVLSRHRADVRMIRWPKSARQDVDVADDFERLRQVDPEG